METSGLLLGLLIFVLFGVLYFLYITKPQRERIIRKQEDLSIIPSRFEEIENMLKEGGPANIKQAIIEADKLVDLGLKTKVKGETMGERLKAARNLFSDKTYDDLWKAHKIRNNVVHEANSETLSFDARRAVKHFEKALQELNLL